MNKHVYVIVVRVHGMSSFQCSMVFSKSLKLSVPFLVNNNDNSIHTRIST